MYAKLDSDMKFQRLERLTAITTFTNLSLSYLLLVKFRIFLEWVIKRILQVGYRRKALRPLRHLVNSRTADAALIIGNGPSSNLLNWPCVLNAQDQGLAVFAINFYPISQQFDVCRPDFLVLSDPQMKPDALSDCRNTDLWLIIKMHSQIDIIVPVSWYKILRKQKDIFNKIYYFDDIGMEGWTRNISPMHARGYLALTAYKAMAVALYMGFRETNIIGIDNSMFQTISVDSDNKLTQEPNHFFAQGGKTSDLTKFYPKGISDYFYDVSLCFYFLRHCFVSQSIINLDPTSLVDVFPKNLQSILVSPYPS